MMKNNVLIIVAHPDDEILGVGGTILKHINNGDEVNCLILSNGEDSRGEDKSNNKKRKKQAEEVSKRIGFKKMILKDLPDNSFDSLLLLEVVKNVEETVFTIKPNIIYTHCGNDLNVDHRMTFASVLTCCRPQPDFFVKEIYSFETLSSTEWQVKSSKMIFKPNYYNNIDNYINEKLEIMAIYKDELRNYPHPRSIEGIKLLSQYRGMEVGYKNAEAFEIIRIIN